MVKVDSWLELKSTYGRILAGKTINIVNWSMILTSRREQNMYGFDEHLNKKGLNEQLIMVDSSKFTVTNFGIMI